MVHSVTEEIKARLDIAEHLSAYLQLTRAGTNLKGLCPFHAEKTPSFMVSRAKQMWHCFGCGEGGDIFTFTMKMEGLEFPEALKLLAEKSGVELPSYDKAAASQRTKIREILKAATEFYSQKLFSPQGQVAYAYLKKRGLSEEIIREFGLGYAPDAWDALVTRLQTKYPSPDLLAAGLVVRAAREQKYYDRFRHRVMFPIRDLRGATVAFTSRLLDETRQEGKYVNTAELGGLAPASGAQERYDSKGYFLYGLDLSWRAIREAGFAVLVEGNMDVIACHQFGLRNTVAASGTALTVEQLRLLKRYTNEIRLAFDADSAGARASSRGIALALEEGLQVRVILIPVGDGKDPDECVRKDLSLWQTAVAQAQEVMEYFFESAQKQFDCATAYGRSRLVGALLPEIVKITDVIVQDFWLKKLSELTQVGEKLLREQLQKAQSPKPKAQSQKSPSPSVFHPPSLEHPRSDLLTERFLALLLFSEAVREQLAQAPPHEDIFTPLLKQHLYKAIVDCYTVYKSTKGSSAILEDAEFRQFWRMWAGPRDPTILSTTDQLELLGDQEFTAWKSSLLKQEAHFLIQELLREYQKRRRFELQQAMRVAEQARDQARVRELTREFEKLSRYAQEDQKN